MPLLLTGIPGRAQQEQGGALAPTQSISGGYAPLRIKLPYPSGTSRRIIQGNRGTFSHTGLNLYAWDFAMPVGSPVVAAAAGRVVRIKQDSDRGGPSPEFIPHGNFLVLDHGDGYFSQYLHLNHMSVKVEEGDLVTAGQIVAESGNTGFSTTPHLHFQVQNVLGQSLPVRFVDVEGNGIPVLGRVYTSGNDGTGTSHYAGPSLLRGDFFARNGIRIDTSNVPAQLLSTSTDYTLAGTAPTAHSRVTLFIMGPEGGHSIFHRTVTSDASGKFRMNFQLPPTRFRRRAWSDELSQSNHFTLALTVNRDDGSYWSDYSIPISIR